MPDDETSILRVIDAAGNRAGEGLRVVDDYLRFALDDRHLTEVCKSIRHDLTDAIASVPQAQRHASRETQADVGTSVVTPSEQSRSDLAAVVAANFKRVEQALRSLEEYGKLIDQQASAQFEQLRYRVYTLERIIDITRESCERLANARVYVLIDGRGSVDEFKRLAGALIEAGVQVLQLRDKRLADRELVERARALRKLTRGTGTLFVMNDRPDLARLADADGVHVGQEELSIKDARTIVGPRALVGVSTHSLDQARQAVLDGANYIGVGPAFPSTTKSFESFTGLELLHAVAAEIRLPAFAIGGITLDNLNAVLQTGVHGVAVSDAVCGSSDPAASAREFVKRLGTARR